MSDETSERRGRKTKEDEARDYLASLGLDPDLVLAGTSDDAYPETPEAMRDAFMRILWSRRNTMADTAFTNAVKAISQLAATVKPDDDPAAEPLVADVIDGIVHLPADRKREILARELERLDAERTRIVEVLNV